MKKEALLLILTFMISSTWSQTSFRTALSSVENIEYTEYWNIYKDESGQQITDPRWKVNLIPQKNEFGKIIGFDAVDISEGKKRIFYAYQNDFLDHYAHPAFIRNSETKRAYAMIEGVLFEFEKMSEDGSSFSIDALWFPKETPQKNTNDDNSEEPEKKKVSLKDRLNKLKESMAGNPLVNEFKQKDLNQFVRDYFSEMKKYQLAHPMTPQEKKEAAKMKQNAENWDAEVQKKNAAYWNSEEGQRVRQQMNRENGSASKWTIHNVGNKTIDVGINGQTKSLKPGDKWEISCLSDAYYARLEGTQWKHEGLIGNGKNNCGKTVTVQ